MDSAHRYQEIAEALRARVESSVYGPGDRLPSERTLTEEFDVHRATLRRALAVLEQDRVILRDGKRGTFVAGRNLTSILRVALCVGGARDTDAPQLMAQGLADVFGRSGVDYRVIHWSRTVGPGRIEAVAPTPLEARRDDLDAVAIYAGADTSAASLRELAEYLPVILLDRRLAGVALDFVGFDDYGAGRRAARHLVMNGRRRIAFFGGVETETAYDRARGVRDELRENGLSLKWPFAMVDGGLVDWPASTRSHLLNGEGERVDGVVCGNDQTAFKSLRVFQEAGLRVPEDVALVGFGNTQPEVLEALGLTTLAQPFRGVGAVAGERILARLRQPSSGLAGGFERRLEMTLVVRRSCGVDFDGLGADSAR